MKDDIQDRDKEVRRQLERETDRLSGHDEFFSPKLGVKFRSCLTAQAVRQRRELQITHHLIKESSKKAICSEKDIFQEVEEDAAKTCLLVPLLPVSAYPGHRDEPLGTAQEAT